MKNKFVYGWQQGSSADLKVSDESKFYLVKETWTGNQVTNTNIIGRFNTKEEVKKAMKDANNGR